MYWMLSQKARNVDQGTDHKQTLTKKAQAAVDKAMRLLAIELNLEKGSLELTVANVIAERKTQAAMQYQVQTKVLQKIPWQSVEPTGNCAGLPDKDKLTIEGGMPKGTIAE